MKIVLATVDLLRGRERLMPWRTVIEVAKYAMRQGHEALVLTMPVSGENVAYEFEGVNILTAPRDFDAFCEYVARKRYDALFYPMPWREGLKNLSAFERLNCVKVAYFPGGSVRLGNILSLCRHAGWRATKPFLIDWLTPYGLLMGKLRQTGFKTVIAQSPYTARTCLKGGFVDVRMIVPGKDSFDTLAEDDSILNQQGLLQKKYLLFTGAPTPIRGASLLLRAIDKAAERDKTIFCVFLIRRDVRAGDTNFEDAYRKMVHKENVQIVDAKLERNELKTLMAHARGVALPFLLIPSEIPLTFFEVMSLGVPVVTFENGGTTDYLGDSVLASPSGQLTGLTDNLLRLWQDDALYSELRNRALQKMHQHPTWDEVAQRWLDCVK